MVLYSNRLVDFTGWPAWIIYGDTEATADFGQINQPVQGGDRLKVDTTDRLRFFLPAAQVGSANAGGIIKAGIEPRDEYLFEYEIRFDAGFPWSKGGKIPGVSGGAGYTGGVPATAGDGFSVRIMWREDGRLIPYVYHYNQPENFGDTFGKTLGYVTNTKAHNIRYHVKLNTGANADGILQIWLDDALVLRKTDLVYRTDTSSIDTAHLAIFPGGSDATWNMTADGYIRLSYVKWEEPVYSEFTLLEKPTDIPAFTSTGTQEFKINFAASGEQTLPVFTAAAIQEKAEVFNQAAANTIAPFAVTTNAEKIDPPPQTFAAGATDFIGLTTAAKIEGTHWFPYEIEILKPNTLFEPLPKDREMVERNKTPNRGGSYSTSAPGQIKKMVDILNNTEARGRR